MGASTAPGSDNVLPESDSVEATRRRRAEWSDPEWRRVHDVSDVAAVVAMNDIDTLLAALDAERRRSAALRKEIDEDALLNILNAQVTGLKAENAALRAGVSPWWEAIRKDVEAGRQHMTLTPATLDDVQLDEIW